MNADCKSIMPIQIRVILTIALLAFALPPQRITKKRSPHLGGRWALANLVRT